MIRNVPPTLAKKVDRPQGAVNPAIPIVPAVDRERGAKATWSKTERKCLTQTKKEEGKLPAAGVNPDAV
ncbi:hypothetical protein BK661_03935 [Pseudomonas frederiksbergensis]|jgi:hypothetical protein|uniref:Uncharacterized protein n=1 Tax=Pseudomonas frederiksbergensis TaxID=104087 RepID=A0A423JCV1_9PSED|nr:hypothetical protein BK661_03935 [Pseudomonas frederiksbergensis]